MSTLVQVSSDSAKRASDYRESFFHFRFALCMFETSAWVLSIMNILRVFPFYSRLYTSTELRRLRECELHQTDLETCRVFSGGKTWAWWPWTANTATERIQFSSLKMWTWWTTNMLGWCYQNIKHSYFFILRNLSIVANSKVFAHQEQGPLLEKKPLKMANRDEAYIFFLEANFVSFCTMPRQYRKITAAVSKQCCVSSKWSSRRSMDARNLYINERN